jgi:hypothetical protein
MPYDDNITNEHIELNEKFEVILNSEITEKEIEDSIRLLKNNKAAGYDQIVNDYLKVSNPRLISIYCNIFNIVFNSGVIPQSWSIGIILPIYKNKGDPKDPDNYRAITLVSCLGKLFTAIINNRLSLLADKINLISECQTGFRKGYSTIDNIFSLHALISLYFSLGKKLLCSFIDFRKAFDTVENRTLANITKVRYPWEMF